MPARRVWGAGRLRRGAQGHARGRRGGGLSRGVRGAGGGVLPREKPNDGSRILILASSVGSKASFVANSIEIWQASGAGGSDALQSQVRLNLSTGGS